VTERELWTVPDAPGVGEMRGRPDAGASLLAPSGWPRKQHHLAPNARSL